MYRLGYLELIEYKDILIYPVCLLLIVFLTVICIIYMRISFDRIVKDFRDNKLDCLDIRSSKLKKFYNVFILVGGDVNFYIAYNYLCYMNAIVELKNVNEERFLEELDNCKKKKMFPLRPVILALYYLSQNDKEKAITYYKEYLMCENKNKEINDVMAYMFENKGTSEEMQMYKAWKNGIQNSVMLEIIDNIEQPLNEGENIRNLVEDKKIPKQRRRWIFILILLLILYYQFSKLPWKVMFSTYSSPEAAYASVYPENILQLRLEGNDSCLLIGSNSRRHDHLMVSKKNGKWKVEMDSDVEVREDNLDSVFYYYYQYDDIDNYLIAKAPESVEFEMTDSCDSEFALIKSEKVTVGQMKGAYIKGYNENYWFDINGTKIVFNLN